MGASPEVRVAIENDGMMKRYQPALGESLDLFDGSERILVHGLASVGNCQGYYFITDRGIHYCDSEKAGLFKRTYISRFFPRSQVTAWTINGVKPVRAYLCLYGQDGQEVLVMKFDDQWQRASCLEQAEAAAQALAVE